MTRRLTKEERAQTYRDHGGRCYCCGENIDALDTWHVVEGSFLFCSYCRRLIGSRTLEEFGAWLVDQVNAAEELVERFPCRPAAEGRICFFGETKESTFGGEAP